ncbi:hypothetical protein VT84_19150 [Gemmata sp. SH-PL17]|uniref:TIGR03943 family putative permease subunit n=1 Tax=Gemmata sp. SH-PL17 TaxID=1630693 RepID=UPI00078D7632|nr:hypothetical protein [Gemmata sp. SH-PL17]AMV26525.1 hypothetical protein VT84_19150 [Gemmata sp. SH-PL17]
MAHNHAGCQSPRDYFTEQLLTILVCGGLAFVAVQLYRYDMLRHILAPQFHLPVLIGGIAVFGLVVLRAVAVWREAGALVPVSDDPTCQQNHIHTANCNHLPGLPGGETDPNLVDDHGHSHDMSWMFARMLILVFPIALFSLGIPNSGLSSEAQRKALGQDVSLDPVMLKEMAKAKTTKVEEESSASDGAVTRTLRTESGLMIREMIAKDGTETYSVIAQGGEEMRFNTLTEAAFDADKRKSYAGQTAIMEGRFNPIVGGSGKEFTLFRQKMTCCGSDAVPLKVRIVSPQAVDRKYFDWVRVKGVVQFRQVPGQDRYIPVLMLGDVTDIQLIPNDQVKNEYEF